MESGDYDAIQQWASDGIRDDRSPTEGVKATSDNIGAESNTPLNLCPNHVYPKKSEGSVDTDVMEEEPLRMIPDRSSGAKPLLSDHRHSIFTKYGEELVVFAPPGVPYSEIARAIKTPVDWRHMRPTSSKCTKWTKGPSSKKCQKCPQKMAQKRAQGKKSSKKSSKKGSKKGSRKKAL